MRRHEIHPLTQRSMEWGLVYSSLIIILLTVFVGMCAYARLEQGKLIEIGRSFKDALDLLPGKRLFDKGRQEAAQPAELASQASMHIARTIYEMLRGRGIEEQVTLASSSESIHLTMADSIIFEKDSAVVKDAAMPLLSGMAKIFAGLDTSVHIEGHVDDSMTQDAGRAGWQLSAMRAINVMRCLHDQGDIPPDRLSAVGYSKYRPYVLGRSADDRARNRRIEIVIPVSDAFYERQSGMFRQSPPSFKVWDLAS